MRRLSLLPLLLALLIAGEVQPARAVEAPALDQEAEVSLDAGSLSYDRATDTFHASENVVLKRGQLQLRSESITWNRSTGLATASGNVTLVAPEGTMSGEKLSYNLQDGTGRLVSGRVVATEGNFHLAGREIEKLGEQQFQVTSGTFTTCEGPKPDWKFGASRLDVTLGGYARARNVIFYIRDVPVFYVPYLVYPAKTERESGLLLPRYGYSSRRGTQFSLAWYQVIQRNMDATLELDYMSQFGVGTGLEFRYALDENEEGWLHAYRVFEDQREDRTSFSGQHRGELGQDVRLSADIDYVNSRDYYADLGEDYDVYTRDKAQTVVYLAKSWDKLNLAGQAKYLKDLEQKSEGTLQRLPEVRLARIRQRLGTSPVFLQLDAAGNHFWRRKGLKGGRLDLRPALSTDLFSNPWFEIVPEAGYRQRLYQAGGDFDHHGIYDLGARASSLVARVYEVDGDQVRRVRHSIQPEIGYLFIPDEDQTDLPEFDTMDRIGPVNRLDYALTNRFTARLEPENGDPYYHEFLYLRLSQSFDVKESRRTPDPFEDSTRAFSPILLEAVIRPNRWSYVDTDASYDPNAGENRLVEFNVRGALSDAGGNSLSVDYRNRRGELEYLSGEITTSLLKPVYLNYLYRYDLRAGKALENEVETEYRGRCWSLFLNYRERPDEREVLVSFALSGLGRVAGIGSSRSRNE